MDYNYRNMNEKTSLRQRKYEAEEIELILKQLKAIEIAFMELKMLERAKLEGIPARWHSLYATNGVGVKGNEK